MYRKTLDEMSGMTWGEFCAWLNGAFSADFNTNSQLLRLIAFQQLTLNPYVDKAAKPSRVDEYFRFPNEKKRTVEPISTESVDKMIKAWKVVEH